MSAAIYRKYAVFILGAFFSLYALSVIWLFTSYHLPQKDTFWINSLYEKKEAVAESIQGSKIVIVSGSSGLFGISAAQMESHFQVPTVNLSTHAALRDYYLTRAKNSIHAGDLVLFAPEYDHYFFDFPIMNEVKSDFIVNYDKAALKKLPLSEQMDILKSYANPWKLLKKVLADIRSKNSGNETIGYNAKNLNANGDETSNLGTRELFFEPIPMSRRFDANTYGMQKIAEFLDWCCHEKVSVIVAWPGTLAFKKTPHGAEDRFIDSLIAFLSNAGVEALGKPTDFFIPENYLFDTIYHLNSEGASHETAQIIRFLEKSSTFASWRQKNAGAFDPVEADSYRPEMVDVCANGSMEKNAKNKPLGWKSVIEKKTEGIALWDNSSAHSGNYCLKLQNTSSVQTRWVGEKVLLPAGVQVIHAGGWSKAENVEAHARYCINLKTFFKDGSFKWNSRKLTFPAGTHDWVQVQTDLAFDAEIIAVQPFLMLHGGAGTVWFDDIVMKISENGVSEK